MVNKHLKPVWYKINKTIIKDIVNKNIVKHNIFEDIVENVWTYVEINIDGNILLPIYDEIERRIKND